MEEEEEKNEEKNAHGKKPGKTDEEGEGFWSLATPP